jgi:hypothetical protein
VHGDKLGEPDEGLIGLCCIKYVVNDKYQASLKDELNVPAIHNKPNTAQPYQTQTFSFTPHSENQKK